MMFQARLAMVVVVEVDFAITTIYVNNNGKEKSSLFSPFIYYLLFLHNTQTATKSSL
jgi:hypothetical protein